MPDQTHAPGAVFLSYASQDAGAALRICEALRAAGVEVWFDQSELRGGDAWDQKIRRQIKECALFVPIISAATQARHEGYFRLEWHLAEQRSHLIARGRPFIVPVAIDQTNDAEALVPDAFLAVQWMRLPGGEVQAAFCDRVKKLLSPEQGAGTLPARPRSGDGEQGGQRTEPVAPLSVAKAERRRVWLWIVAAVIALPVLYLIFRPRRSPEEIAKLLSTVQAIAETAAAKSAANAKPAAVPAATFPEGPKPSTDQERAVAVEPGDLKSVAVLAFANLSDDKGNEYFSDGISEELLNVLAKIPGLKVTARTSSFHYKGKDTPIPEIARELGVAYVIEGSVRKAGDKVRITAQLIKAADGFHVWSDTFTRDLKDIFAVQDEIAGLIAQQLQLKLGDGPRVAKTVNPEAHQLYLQGKYFLNQFSVDSANRAVGLLQQAVELDPSFAPAWAALSRAGSVLGGYADTRQDAEKGMALARLAAERALALEPDLAAAHLALAEVQTGHDFDWQGAAGSLRRALALAPADAAVIDSAARLAYYFGQKAKSVELGAQAVALDPVNPSVRVDHGFALNSVRRFPEAEAEFRRLIELNPKAPWGHAGVSFNFTTQGRFDEAAAEAVQETNDWSRLYALTLAQWGQKKQSEADATLTQFIKADADIAAYQIAEIYAFRGDSDRAFEWLDRAYRQRDPGLAWSRSDIFLENLYPDPRWEKFMRKLGLADEQLK